MDAYNKNKGEKSIFSECVFIDWYDGPVNGVVKLADSSQWYLFSLAFFEPEIRIRIFSLIETSVEWVNELKSTMPADKAAPMPNYKDVKNEMKESYENYQGNAYLLKAGQVDDADCEIVKIPASSLKYFDDSEDTFEQDKKYVGQLKVYFSYGQPVYYVEMKNLLKEQQLYKHYSTLDEMVKRYRKFVMGLYQYGYDDYMVEFDNDISVRYHIEAILKSEKLSPYPEWNDFLKKVHEIDNILRGSFIPSIERSETNSWWEKGILKKGSGNYANDVKLMYGLDITGPL